MEAADPFALVGALSVAATSIQMVSQLVSIYTEVSSSTYNAPKKILSELPVLISLLKEIQENVSTSYTEPGVTVSGAMQICIARFQDLSLCLAMMGLRPSNRQHIARKASQDAAFYSSLPLDEYNRATRGD